MLITNQKELEAFCNSIKNAPFITVDTEFLREKTYYPKLCLIQIGDPDKNAAAIDPLSDDIDLQPVFNLLFDEKILKILHAARQDLEIFFKLTDKVPAPLFDTQIAAMVCGYGESVGYERLVNDITKQKIDKSSQFTDWSRRPLSQKQLDYALADVTHLVDIYEHLSEQLEKTGRTAWVDEENKTMNDPATYHMDPYQTWKRVKMRSPKPKTLAVLRELAAWREQRAQDKDLPRNWVMRDEVLIALATQTPQDEDALGKIRNIGKDLVKGEKAKTLIKLIKSALKTKPSDCPEKNTSPPMHSNAQAAYDMLRFLLKLNADEHDVASKLIAGKEDLQALAMSNRVDIPAMKGWRFDVFGKDALDMKSGQLSIGLDNGKIVKFDTHDAED